MLSSFLKESLNSISSEKKLTSFDFGSNMSNCRDQLFSYLKTSSGMKWSARKKKESKIKKEEEIIRYKTKEMNILTQYHQRISRHYVILADMSSYTSFPLALSVWK